MREAVNYGGDARRWFSWERDVSYLGEASENCIALARERAGNVEYESELNSPLLFMAHYLFDWYCHVAHSIFHGLSTSTRIPTGGGLRHANRHFI